MSLILKKAFRKLPFCHGKTTNEGLKLTQSSRVNPTPADAIKALELELTEERTKFVRLEQEYQRAKDELKTLSGAKRELDTEILEVRELLEARGKDLDKTQAKVNESLAAAAHARELSARLSAMEKLLLERTVELKAAQAFLTKADDVSEAELVGTVDNLNSLVSSASGALSVSWDPEEPLPGTHVEYPDLKQICETLGSSTFEQIAARNPVAVTLAIQTYLCDFIQRITSGWGGGQAAWTLSEIYGMISTKESQTIASRWRTLTKRYTPYQELPQSDELISGLAGILLISRSFPDFSAAKEFVAITAGSEIEAVIKATVQMDDTIKTKIASCDMFVYVAPPGTVFTKETMSDEFKQGGEHQVVAGTMEIGLFQRSGSVDKVLRKPKVILERDLVEPEAEARDEK